MQIRCRGIILDKEGKMLVVKHSVDFDYYALPGGKMDEGESPLECIHREIMEEFGVEIESPKLLYVHNWKNKEGIQNLEFFFLIKNGEDFKDLENKDRTHAFELFEIKWIDREIEINLLPEIILEEFKNNNFDFNEVKFI